MKIEKGYQFGAVRFIPGKKNGKYPSCNSVYVEGTGVLIDPGSDRDYLIKLKENNAVNMVWLSHSHEDHFTHLDLFDDLPLWTSKQEAAPLYDVERFLDAYGMFKKDYRDYWRVILKDKFNFRSRKPEKFLSGGEIVGLKEVTVEIIKTPGHTPGHLAFYFKEPQVLFIGDYDLTPFGPFYGDLHASIEDTIGSIAYLRTIPAKVWFTSHETGILKEMPRCRWDNYLNVIEEREKKLFVLLEKPHSMEEIVREWIIYRKPREPRALFEFAEHAMMRKHLIRLMEQNLVQMNGGVYRRS